ncbi:MAG: hypothetical protein K5905_19595, partial [Roseibium sp.]|uniref:hypothetical protein n=1 Tax=Roseibium sp. TaxID=1936156 RepID=UPI00261F1C4B
MRFIGTLVFRAITLVWFTGLVAGVFTTQPTWATEFKRTMHIAKFLKFEKPGKAHPQKIGLSGYTPRKLELKPRLDTPLARRWAMARTRLNAEADWLNSCRSGACRDPRADTWFKTVSLIRSTTA